MVRRKLAKLLRDPDRFFEDYFAKRRKRARSRGPGVLRSALHYVLQSTAKPLADYQRTPPLDRKMVLYDSMNGKRMSCNPYAIFKYLIGDPRFAEYRHVWVLDAPEAYAPKYKGMGQVELVRKGSARHRHCMAVAKYLITNNTFPPSFSKREGQVYVNTQHGVPIKTLGKDVEHAFGFGANVTRNLLHTDYLVMPNRYTTEVILRSHDVDALFDGCVIETGYPRWDLARQGAAFRSKLLTELGIPEGKKVLLYAPTYRGDFRASVDRSVETHEFVQALRDRYGSEYVILSKAHHVEKAVDSEVSRRLDAIDTNELLGIVDVLITDYSSVAFDFFAHRKPIIYFAYDLEEYSHVRGMYLDLKDLPGVVCRDTASVMAELDDIGSFMTRHAAAYDRAIDEYCGGDDGHVTERVVETIFLGRPCASSYRLPRGDRRRILIYGGGFLNNGVTSSVSSLLKAIDPEEFDLYIVFNRAASAENVARFQARVPEHVKVLFYMKSGASASFSLDQDQHGKDEARRLFGDAKFDIAIDANGYGKLWPAVMAYVNAERRYIYLHSCMKSEQTLRPHLADFDYLFSLYERRYDRLINVSQSSYLANAEHLPHLADRMMYIDNLVDDVRIRSLATEDDVDPEHTNFVNIGRYAHEKGLDRLISAFSCVHKEHPDTRLYLVGHGPQEMLLKRHALELGVAHAVIFVGKMENPFRLLRKCDCFVMSSRYEGQGIVLLEALVLGIPCISVDIPGPRSILEPQFLYEDSEQGLVRGMLDFIEGRVSKQPFDPHAYNSRSKKKLELLLSAAS